MLTVCRLQRALKCRLTIARRSRPRKSRNEERRGVRNRRTRTSRALAKPTPCSKRASKESSHQTSASCRQARPASWSAKRPRPLHCRGDHLKCRTLAGSETSKPLTRTPSRRTSPRRTRSTLLSSRVRPKHRLKSRSPRRRRTTRTSLNLAETASRVNSSNLPTDLLITQHQWVERWAGASLTVQRRTKAAPSRAATRRRLRRRACRTGPKAGLTRWRCLRARGQSQVKALRDRASTSRTERSNPFEF